MTHVTEQHWLNGALGHLRVKMALMRAGIEVATPEHEHGIDLLAFRWSSARQDYVARPLQIKTAATSPSAFCASTSASSGS